MRWRAAICIFIIAIGSVFSVPAAGKPNRAMRREQQRNALGSRMVFWPLGCSGVYCYDSFTRTGYIRTRYNPNGYHWAQDFSSRRTSAGWVNIAGQAVYTPVNGTVHENGYNAYWGWYFTVLAPDGDIWLCAHLRYQCKLRVGTRIGTTRLLAGYVGQSGNATGPHLHVEHWMGQVRDNPASPHRYDTYPTHYNSKFVQSGSYHQ